MKPKIVKINKSLSAYIGYPKKSNGAAIIVGMEIFGVNDDIKEIVDHFAENGYTAIAIDFYHKIRPMISLGYTDKERDEGLRLMKTLNRAQVMEDIEQTIFYLHNKEHLYEIGFAGFSIGGHIGYLAATLKDIEATAVFCPGWLTNSDIPLNTTNPPIHLTKEIKGNILLIAGELDNLVTPKIVDEIEDSLIHNNIPHQIVRYPNTKHAFYIKARTSTYNEAVSENAWQKTIQFFNRSFKNTMEKKVLFVVTSHDKKGSTDQPTGYYLSEVSHPWEVLHNAGYEIDFVSPQGGKAPVDGFNLDDPINKKFWDDTTYRNKIEHTMKPSEVKPEEYAAILYAGGHGAMWDFADNLELAKIAAKIYENNGVVSAVCHGPAGLANIKLSNGKYLVDGKKINAFTNEEEVAVGLDKVVPFMLETKLIERGAKFEKSGLWQTHTTVDQRLVTGQNPSSAKGVGEATLEELKKIK